MGDWLRLGKLEYELLNTMGFYLGAGKTLMWAHQHNGVLLGGCLHHGRGCINMWLRRGGDKNVVIL
jgi:hypothetical protein